MRIYYLKRLALSCNSGIIAVWYLQKPMIIWCGLIPSHSQPFGTIHNHSESIQNRLESLGPIQYLSEALKIVQNRSIHQPKSLVLQRELLVECHCSILTMIVNSLTVTFRNISLAPFDCCCKHFFQLLVCIWCLWLNKSWVYNSKCR